MATHIQPKHIGDLLVREISGLSKERVMLAAGAAYAFGTVLATVGADYAEGATFEALDPVAIDGTEKAFAVLAEAVDATTGAAPGLAIARMAIVNADELVWPAGITGPQKAAAIAQLEARGIVARTLQ